jgi:hypothetical protein
VHTGEFMLTGPNNNNKKKKNMAESEEKVQGNVIRQSSRVRVL